MRDPKRIPKILAKLQLLWEELPDQRLCQLISNVTGRSRGQDIFYIEDEDFEKMIDEMYDRFLVVKPQDND